MDIAPYDRDGDLIEAVKKDRMPRVRIHRPEGVLVVLGRGGKPEIELKVSACAADRVPVRKRRGGGCAVVLDPGNVIVSLVLPIGGISQNRRIFSRISEWLITGLEKAGLTGVEREGVSDLAVSGKKIGGACLYRSKHLLFHPTTLLVDPALDRVERYLKHPPREPSYRNGRRHEDFMGTLALVGWREDAAALARSLRHLLHPGEAFQSVRGAYPGSGTHLGAPDISPPSGGIP